MASGSLFNGTPAMDILSLRVPRSFLPAVEICLVDCKYFMYPVWLISKWLKALELFLRGGAKRPSWIPTLPFLTPAYYPSFKGSDSMRWPKQLRFSPIMSDTSRGDLRRYKLSLAPSPSS